ncbi:dehydrogenase [Aliifodinibius salipaludis]|uniref:Dehydrogenase n=1 Tax=Fodinibius salipaludis TaxID=2032627 RepID=A0A2A2G847_9BACT|nr:bi-domain-containing oxidoreductase [Aliifodinibius salipaludis]PAU93164.1 dehydrogenase [Aliifodinibius salipaludis]
MYQIIQDLKSGETILEEVPTPRVGAGKVLIKTQRSLVSLGTEKMLVNFGQANLLEKARQQPEKVKQVIDKMKTDGIKPTLEAVFRKLDTPLPLGYSQAGEVIAVGKGVTEFQVGDRVISNGNHAEVVAVPKNLVAKIPEGVSYDEASFTVVGAIGLQGIRLIKPTFGETVVVLGLGLIGIISAQILKANGCNVIGLDLDPDKVEKARSYGITAINSGQQDPVKFVEQKTNNVGADAVLITASTKSNAVIKQAANMSRKRGRIVLVGVVGLDIDRSDFYEKELSFQVSCSYGPGRYDEEYEQKGNDYPLPYVRWTEKRNFQSVLEAMKKGQLDVESLITERVPLKDYEQIYGDMDGSDSIASILEYPLNTEDSEEYTESAEKNNRTIKVNDVSFEGGTGTMAVIGAGNFTQAMIMPSLDNAGADVKYIVSSGGLSSTTLSKKYDVPNSTTDLGTVLADDQVEGVLITTRHNLHAGMTVQALKAGKQVFVEKPLALKQEELDEIIETVEETGNTITVGFNRRFSPHAEKMKKLLGQQPGPMNVIATMNAGHIPADVWVHDPEVGGGRIVGEACHYVDLITYLTGSKVTEVSMHAMGENPKENTDNASIHLKYENGSLGVINYFANGNKSYSKERVEVYHQGKNLIMDNFRKLYAYGFDNSFFSLSNKILSTKQDKGHAKQFELLTQCWQEGGEPLIPFDEIVNTTRATFAAIESLKQGKWISL